MSAKSAPEALRFRDDDRDTLMPAACYRGHLSVVKCLFEVDAALTIRAPNKGGIAPIQAACVKDHITIVAWLVLKGAASSDGGHVDPVLLRHGVSPPPTGPPWPPLSSAFGSRGHGAAPAPRPAPVPCPSCCAVAVGRRCSSAWPTSPGWLVGAS